MPIPKLSRTGLLGLARAAAHPRALLTRHIGARLREQIILHVSSVNECAVCSALHGAGAKTCGLDDEAIRAARQRLEESAVDERTKVALRYAELRTRDAEDADPAACEAFAAQYDEHEQREIRAVVDLFTFNNQFNNTWEGVLPGAEGRRRKLGLGGGSG